MGWKELVGTTLVDAVCKRRALWSYPLRAKRSFGVGMAAPELARDVVRKRLGGQFILNELFEKGAVATRQSAAINEDRGCVG